MGIFSQSTTQNGPPAVAARRRQEAHGLSIVAPDLVVTGDLKADGVIRVEGQVSGNVEAGGQILLSEGGVIQGDLRTREAVIAGEVRGSITASERVEVQATASVEGDILTPRLLMQEGGRVNGAVRMEAAAEVVSGSS